MRIETYWESGIEPGPLATTQLRRRTSERVEHAITRHEELLGQAEDREAELLAKVEARESVGRPVLKRFDDELVSLRDRIEHLQLKIACLRMELGEDDA